MPIEPTPSRDTRPLFFFGSLMDTELLSVVVDRSVAADELAGARLSGWTRVRAADESYPILVPAPGAYVDGVLFRAGPRERERILFFEDYDYALEPCSPVTDDGRTVEAQACFAGDRIRATDRPWSLETWRADGKAELLFLARRYMACFGAMDVEAAEAVWLRAKADWAAMRAGAA